MVQTLNLVFRTYSWLTRRCGTQLIGLAVIWVALASPTAWGQQYWLQNGTSIYYNNGNVGIGTMDPQVDRLRLSGASTVGFYLSDASRAWFGSRGSTRLELAAGDGTPGAGGYGGLVIVPNSGHVGIGTTAPSNLLHLKAPGDTGDQFAGLRFIPASANGSTTGNYHVVLGFRHSGLALGGSASGNAFAKSYIFLNDGGVSIGMSDMYIDPTTNVKFTVLNNGNVGIGTTNPTHKLAVAGTIRTYEVVVNAGWSDYVFRPGYRLRPLKDVAAYIKKNNRLPDIPSEADVKRNGVSVGEMQAKLLAKIEELTLHMIRVDEENRELRDRIAQLERGTRNQ